MFTDTGHFAVVFAERLRERLGATATLTKLDRGYRLSGALPLAMDGMFQGDFAEIDVYVGSDWHVRVPRVRCRDGWLRLGGSEWHVYALGISLLDGWPCIPPRSQATDWHVRADGFLCIEYGRRWSACLEATTNEHGWEAAVARAAEWHHGSTVRLLQQHLVAYRHSLVRWPREWDFWPHDSADAEKRFKQEWRTAS